jgi:hypothetical protein
MRELDPRIHPTSQDSLEEDGCRVKPGHDELRYNASSTAFAISAVPLPPPNSIGLMPSA